MGTQETKTPVKLIHFLPAIYQLAEKDGGNPFLERFLAIFEEILTGVENKNLENTVSLSEQLDAVSQLFHPLSDIYQEKGKFNEYFNSDSDEFLEWLFEWVNLVLKENWTPAKRKNALARIIPLYRMRGTRRGLEEFLNLYVDGTAFVDDDLGPIQIGGTLEDGEVIEGNRLGLDSVVGGMPPYFFIVNIFLPEITEKDLKNISEDDLDKLINRVQHHLWAVEEIVEREKPVHTRHRLNIHVYSLNPESDNATKMGAALANHVGIDTHLWRSDYDVKKKWSEIVRTFENVPPEAETTNCACSDTSQTISQKG